MIRGDHWWQLPEIPDRATVLDLGAGGPATPRNFTPGSATFATSDIRRRDEADGLGGYVSCDVISSLEKPGPFDITFYEPPQREAKQRVFELVDSAFKTMPEGGRLYLAGRKDRGVESYRNRLADVFGNVNLFGRAKRVRLFEATKTGTHPGADPIDPKTFFPVQLKSGTVLEFGSRAGVFSANEFDPGSRFLVESVSSMVSGRVLDFGCGAGTIGIALAAEGSVSDLVMVDVSRLATECAEANLHVHGLAQRGKVYNGDGYSPVDAGSFDWILSNPPFHEGNAVAHPLIKNAPSRLSADGRLALVVMRVEPYLKAIERVFHHVDSFESGTGYTVLVGSQPITTG